MSYRIMHLTLTPYPEPTSLVTIDYACSVASSFGARLNVTSPRLHVRSPKAIVGGAMVRGMAQEFETEAATRSRELETYVQEKAKALGVNVSLARPTMSWPSSVGELTWRGRTSDLCILGLARSGLEEKIDLEDWLFGLGRPCLLFPANRQDPCGLDCVLICWDFSKSAMRAISDALPILKTAKDVRVITVTGEKHLAVEDARSPILEYLAAHEVKAGYTEVQIAGNSIGRTILGEADKVGASLIVMGAYGHSRLKEFILGGATKEILNASSVPLLMAH